MCWASEASPAKFYGTVCTRPSPSHWEPPLPKPNPPPWDLHCPKSNPPPLEGPLEFPESPKSNPAAGTAADAASAAEPPPVAATAVTTVAPSTAAAVAAVAAAAKRVGGAWEGGRVPWEGRGRGGSRGRFGSILDLDVFFWLVWRRFCFFISFVCVIRSI